MARNVRTFLTLKFDFKRVQIKNFVEVAEGGQNIANTKNMYVYQESLNS